MASFIVYTEKRCIKEKALNTQKRNKNKDIKIDCTWFISHLIAVQNLTELKSESTYHKTVKIIPQNPSHISLISEKKY